jgi:hypothetical protein
LHRRVGWTAYRYYLFHSLCTDRTILFAKKIFRFLAMDGAIVYGVHDGVHPNGNGYITGVGTRE